MSRKDKDFPNIEISGKKYYADITTQNIVEVTDRGGKSIYYQLFEGVHVSLISPLSCLRNIKGFKMRSDDIYFPGYPRTGTNWTYEMASMLLNGRAETIPKVKDHLEIISPEDLEQLPSPRIINCHLKLSLAPVDVKRKKIKIIYTLRDPRDVAVSVYNLNYGRNLTGEMYLGSFEDFLHLFMAGTVEYNGYFEHLLDAEAFFAENPDNPVHFQKYEDTIKDPLMSVQKLSDFLGLSRNDELCQAIADKCEFKRMKVDKEDTVKVGGENYLYRKGTVGDWRNYFTENMLEEYYRCYEEKMIGSGFYHLYARDKN